MVVPSRHPSTHTVQRHSNQKKTRVSQWSNSGQMTIDSPRPSVGSTAVIRQDNLLATGTHPLVLARQPRMTRVKRSGWWPADAEMIVPVSDVMLTLHAQWRKAKRTFMLDSVRPEGFRWSLFGLLKTNRVLSCPKKGVVAQNEWKIVPNVYFNFGFQILFK